MIEKLFSPLCLLACEIANRLTREEILYGDSVKNFFDLDGCWAAGRETLLYKHIRRFGENRNGIMVICNQALHCSLTEKRRNYVCNHLQEGGPQRVVGLAHLQNQISDLDA